MRAIAILPVLAGLLCAIPAFAIPLRSPAARGAATLTFDSCTSGTASWTSAIAGYGSGTFPITRLGSISDTVCQ